MEVFSVKLEIKKYRDKQGVTQKELADRVGVSPAAINFFEQGLKTPSLTNAYLIARALNCKIDDLIVI